MIKCLLIWLIIAVCLPVAVSAELQVHFLDVGQGDCTIVLCDGEPMIIDGGPVSASGFLYSYIRNTLELEHLDYMIASHPHEDHIGSLASALNVVPVDLILSPVTEWNSRRFDAILEYADVQGTPVIVPNEGDSLRLGGASITILGGLDGQ